MARIVHERDVVDVVAEAIAQREGFYATHRHGIPSVAQKLNNPGNMRSWKDPTGTPYPTVMGFVSFPTTEIGWRALRAQCRINVVKKNLTALEFFAGRPGTYHGYAADKSDAATYARAVVARLTRALGRDCSAVLSSKAIATLIGLEWGG